MADGDIIVVIDSSDEEPIASGSRRRNAVHGGVKSPKSRRKHPRANRMPAIGEEAAGGRPAQMVDLINDVDCEKSCADDVEVVAVGGRMGLESRAQKDKRAERNRLSGGADGGGGVAADSDDVVSELPGKVGGKRKSNEGRSMECPICLENISHPNSTKCGHLFCQECIREWIKDKKHCPTCREKCNPKDLRSIFL